MSAMPEVGDTITTRWGTALVEEVHDHDTHWSARITYTNTKRTVTYGFCAKDPETTAARR